MKLDIPPDPPTTADLLPTDPITGTAATGSQFPVVVLIVLIVVLVAALVALVVLLQRRRSGGAPGRRT